jgi:N-acetylglucosaminyldiphosphoundecaprenol N-acetyl-beta-D-mannosaminyltransferase
MKRLDGTKMITKEYCYGIHLTFGAENVDNNIMSFINERKKGYVCVVDFNVITISFQDAKYNQIINNADFNTCDGSFLAFLKNLKNGGDYQSYNGPEIFEKFITDSNYKQLILGPSESDFHELIKEVRVSDHLLHLELPFVDVESFEYEEIGDRINAIKPHIIWVLLGAPKQERFISNVMNFVDGGLFFGVGAALNFYLGRINNRTFSIAGLRFIWVERIFKEPKKQIARILNFFSVLPKIIRNI